MIEISSVQESLHQMANKVLVYDTGAAVRLRLLADAVGVTANDAESAKESAEQWATCDIFKLIDPDGIVERFKCHQTRGRLVGLLELLRNTLIFSPIIVTWYGISRAAQAYSELLKTQPDQLSQPFLYLWQQGFEGRLPSILTLSSIANIDAALLAFIFILTFFAFFLSQNNEAHNERDAQNLRADLIHTLVGASLSLQAKQYQLPLTAGDNLEKVAQQIVAMMQQTTTKLDAMTQQTTTKFEMMIHDVLNQFTAMIKQTNEQFALVVTQTNDRLDAMTQKVLNQFDVISHRMQTQLEEGNEYLNKLSPFVSGMDLLSKEFRGTAEALQKANTELMAKISILVEPVKELAEQQSHLATAAKDSVVQLEGATTTLVDLGRKQDRWSSDLNDVLETLAQGVEKAMQLATNVGSFTIQQAAFLEQLGKEREAQYDLTVSTSDATVTLKEALEDLKQGGISLRSIAHDMKDILDLQLSTNTTTIAQSYANAAQAIERGGQSLNISAITIYETGQKLTTIVDELEDRLATRK